MKNSLSLPLFLILISLSGCSISKMETSSTENSEEKKSVAKERDYEVSQRENITRVSFIQTSGGGNQQDIEFNFNSTSNANPPKDFQFRSSNGEIENTPTFRGFRNVQFPFSATLIYKVKPSLSKSNVTNSKQNSTTSNSSKDLRCRLQFTINKPGNWIINITN